MAELKKPVKWVILAAGNQYTRQDTGFFDSDTPKTKNIIIQTEPNRRFSSHRPADNSVFGKVYRDAWLEGALLSPPGGEITVRYIAVDIGSSFVKSALLDPGTQRIVAIRKESAPERLPASNPHLYEIPAARFVDMYVDHIRHHLAHGGDIGGILLSTQMHGFIYRTGGEDRYVSWQDMRCLDPLPGRSLTGLEALRELLPTSAMLKTGVDLKPSLGLCNLYSMLEANPTLPRDGTLFTLGSYILHKLTGNNVCHITNAAPWGMVDVAAGEWERSILAKTALSDIELPKIAGSDLEVCGNISIAGCELPVYPDYGDQQTAVLGCLAGEKDAVINIATAAQVVTFASVFSPGRCEVRPYFDRQYINTVSNMPGGRGLDVLIRFLTRTVEEIAGIRPPNEAVWKAALASPDGGSDSLSVDTCFYPVPGNLNGGCISGIRPDNLTLAHIFDAAFSDMADAYWRHIRSLGPTEEITRLVCSGGTAWKIPPLLDAIRKTAGRECILSPIPDECMSGLHRLALVCAGICRNIGETAAMPLRKNQSPTTAQ